MTDSQQTPPTHKQNTIEYYDTYAQEYAKAVDDHYSTEQTTTFMGMLPEKPEVVDVGCGSGRDAFVMTKAGAKVVGVDLSSGMIEYAKSQYPDIEFLQADILNLPFENDTKDGIWAHAVLFHLETMEEVKAALKEFDRVLKPNGILHVLVKLQKDSQKLRVFSDDQNRGQRLYRFFQKEELESLLAEAGFETIISETYDENERNPQGRHDVTWLHCLSKKVR